jgi:DNA repair protein RadD
MITLHQFQHEAVDQIERGFEECQRQLLVAPTGSGKTVVASEVSKRAVDRHQHVLVIAHRREIIQQTHRKLFENGVQAGIIMAGVDPRPMAAVQVASVDTLRVRALRSSTMQLPLAHLVIIDEAHHARAQTYQLIVEAYPNVKVLGLTATPCRGDGRGLGNVFDKMIECPQVADLIKLGFLVPSRVYAPVIPDLKGVKTQSGDWVVSQLAHRMNTDQLVGDIVTHWHKHGERRKTVVFAVNVAHSVHILP